MRFDVAAAAAQAVAADECVMEHEPQTIEEVAMGETFELIEVEQEERHQLLDVVGLPRARDIIFAQSNVATCNDAAQHIPFRYGEGRLGTRLCAFGHMG